MNRVLNKSLICRIDQHQFNQLVRNYYGKKFIGSREVVGYGTNGSYNYIDRVEMPFPAIRFREDTPEIKVLREKEKGDWRNLTIEEKKTLYRASFWRTLAEVEAPTGEWKFTISVVLLVISISFWIEIFFKVFIAPPLPESFSLENRKRQLRLMLDYKIDPVQGISSKWDYERDCWKSQVKDNK